MLSQKILSFSFSLLCSAGFLVGQTCATRLPSACAACENGPAAGSGYCNSNNGIAYFENWTVEVNTIVSSRCAGTGTGSIPPLCRTKECSADIECFEIKLTVIGDCDGNRVSYDHVTCCRPT